ncbi:MAG TPA: hypothetical protein PK060_19215 [Polaromonas sp.]|jgi:hypothetical protein|uniref:hypothetical protein n=1 Tax=unclassified Polaromonas TaxID=2638319 RepID=UPI0026007367|nr:MULTISPECIES: hypothetical protein [unclassified Polaromonas]HQS00366.1 hypothetical protein [Polaromonas sp.]HQT09350.1 hypothetical protein [Polaromonas sp.]
MAKGFETRILVLRWGIWVNQAGGEDDRVVWGNTTQDNVSLYRKMAESLLWINTGGWEVVASIPLDQGSYYGTGLPNSHGIGQRTWGGGYGYGSSATAGSALVLKREIDDAGTCPSCARSSSAAFVRSNACFSVACFYPASSTARDDCFASWRARLTSSKRRRSLAAVRYSVR